MRPQEIIRKKRDGEALTREEFAFLSQGIADGSLSEGQVAAWAMAAFLVGMSREECVELTNCLTRSGTILSWSDAALPGPVLDKHSTGGVGDKVSLMLAPLVAACGGFVPMISGRGLGHTGGTLDKLASIPGYRADPGLDELRRVVREVGCAIIGQTDDLAPADRRLYAVRDITGTVESIPLIAASILSKKLAEGLDGLVVDVKTGSGAFLAEPEESRELATTLMEVATGAGLPTTALLTDMDQVLGRTAGNALEVAETVAYLTDPATREPRLHEVVLALAAEMLLLGRLARSLAEGRAMAEASLDDGRAAETFARMVAALGGPADFLERSASQLARAPVVRPCAAARDGFVAGMDTRAVGILVAELGGGRHRASDTVDPAVGLADVRPVGARVAAGEPLALVHAASEAAAEAAVASLAAIVRITDEAPAPRPVIHDRIDASAVAAGRGAAG